jgi:lysozyme
MGVGPVVKQGVKQTAKQLDEAAGAARTLKGTASILKAPEGTNVNYFSEQVQRALVDRDVVYMTPRELTELHDVDDFTSHALIHNQANRADINSFPVINGTMNNGIYQINSIDGQRVVQYFNKIDPDRPIPIAVNMEGAKEAPHTLQGSIKTIDSPFGTFGDKYALAQKRAREYRPKSTTLEGYYDGIPGPEEGVNLLKNANTPDYAAFASANNAAFRTSTERMGTPQVWDGLQQDWMSASNKATREATTEIQRENIAANVAFDKNFYDSFLNKQPRLLKAADDFVGDSPFRMSLITDDPALRDKPLPLHRIDKDMRRAESGELASWTDPLEMGTHYGSGPASQSFGNSLSNPSKDLQMSFGRLFADIFDNGGDITRQELVDLVELAAWDAGEDTFKRAGSFIEHQFNSAKMRQALKHRLEGLGLGAKDDQVYEDLVLDVASAFRKTRDTVKITAVTRARAPLILQDEGGFTPRTVVSQIRDTERFAKYSDEFDEIVDMTAVASDPKYGEGTQRLQRIIEAEGFDSIGYANVVEPQGAAGPMSYIFWDRQLVKDVGEDALQVRGAANLLSTVLATSLAAGAGAAVQSPKAEASSQELQPSNRGIAFIKRHEGLNLTAYPDAGGWSIGYGHQDSNVKEGDTITKKQAIEFFNSDMEKVDKVIKSTVKVPITQGEYDAIADIIFNTSTSGTAWKKSKALKALNAGDKETFLREAFDSEIGFVRSRNEQGKKTINPVLVKRRQEGESFAREK